jgi:peptide/nickel transport system substrate-binding protein
VRASGRYAVVVTLKKPDAGWQYVPAWTGYVFEKSFQVAHGAKMGEPDTLIQGTGPYVLDSLDPTQGAELSANPHYWGGKLSIRHVSVKFFAGGEPSEALAFRAGKVDLVFPYQEGKAFTATAHTKLISVQSGQINYFSMNTILPPYSDMHVRRAIAYAINRADVIAAAGGEGEPLYTMITPSTLQTIATRSQVDRLYKSLNLYKFNLAKAKDELAKSAYPHGFTTSWDVYDFSTYPVVAQVIAGDLAKIGIKYKINRTPLQKYVSELATTCKGVRQPLNYNADGGVTPDPGAVPKDLYGSKAANSLYENFACYATPAIDRLMAAGTATTNPKKRFAAYSQFLKIAQDDVPYVPLFTTQLDLALSSRFSFPSFNAYTGYGFSGGTWILGVKPR